MRRVIVLSYGSPPRVLLLDAPTVGVDPPSRERIFEAVRAQAACGTAVLYSTHYMKEAERLCDRVGIIDHGHLIAEGTRAELVERIGQHDGVELKASGDLERTATALRQLEGVLGVSPSDGAIKLVVDRADRRLPAIVAGCGGAGSSITSVDVSQPNLESVFLHLTGRALRD